MSRVHCVRCGITGDSKNPQTRSVFADHDPVNKLDTILSWIMKIDQRGEVHPASPEEMRTKTTVSFTLWDHNAVEVLEWLKEMTARDAFIPSVIGCVHNWQLCPGEKAEC